MTQRYRDELTLPELLLWQRLRMRPFGLIFRKQHPVGRLRLDFYCPERRLAIEVDGAAHDHGDRPERDPRRDAWLAQQGIATLRVPARDVLRDADEAAEAIARHALTLPVAFTAAKKPRRVLPTGPSDPLRGPPPHQDGEELIASPRGAPVSHLPAPKDRT